MTALLSNDYFHIFIRLFLALILGGVVGFEREQNNHPAGFRTHILVSIGSALFMLISIYGFTDYISGENISFDPARIAAQVVTGIGFLGAGTILRHGFTVTGLTTAASLWVVAGIGMAVGAGMYYSSILATIFVLISLAVLTKFDSFIASKRQLVQIKVTVFDRPGKLGEIATKLGERKINVRSVSIIDEEISENGDEIVTIVFLLRIPKNEDIPEIVDDIKHINGVKEIQFGKDTE